MGLFSKTPVKSRIQSKSLNFNFCDPKFESFIKRSQEKLAIATAQKQDYHEKLKIMEEYRLSNGVYFSYRFREKVLNHSYDLTSFKIIMQKKLVKHKIN